MSTVNFLMSLGLACALAFCAWAGWKIRAGYEAHIG